MSAPLIDDHIISYWFVGASYGGDDQTERFLAQGIWENGFEDKLLDDVRAMRPGDRIAIKSAYTRKYDLPFDARDQAVSVMAIKATGTITENLNDGRHVRVDWQKLDSPREWYFYTNRQTIWHVQPDNWKTEALIEFAFGDNPQDIQRFRNAPFWRERYGNDPEPDARFAWAAFYEQVATGLLRYKDKRIELMQGLHEISGRTNPFSQLRDKYADGNSGPLSDICPFTVFGIFNRGLTPANRTAIATELAHFLGVEVEAPKQFDGIPIMNNTNSWFFSNAGERKADDIDSLWRAFEYAIRYADTDEPEVLDKFIAAYDDALSRRNVAWNLTTGMYWARPWNYPTLDTNTREYINDKLGIDIGSSAPGGKCSAKDYLQLKQELQPRFSEENFPVHSFPELSFAAWKHSHKKKDSEKQTTEPADEAPLPDTGMTAATADPYSIADIAEDGCFLDETEIEHLLSRLKMKKNLILQGPPGTGKTWLAKRLAFALIGRRDESKVRPLQFHPTLSYEDFVRGWRPAGDGKLELIDGPFLEMILTARGDSANKYAVVIEEINRGNPAQVFGELLTLLEADKRTPNEAMELCYKTSSKERVYVPDNLYLIGTMNIADRSLALVDLAFRRRFAFANLEPRLGNKWRDWVHKQNAVPKGDLVDIEKRLSHLNARIAEDASLGKQFRIGHSYVTPGHSETIPDTYDWFSQVVETEIAPLLEEYWFDALDKAEEAKSALLEGL